MIVLKEMATHKVLFRGDSEIDQLFQIFRILGTPDEETWPGVSRLPDYKTTFPKWRAQLLSTHAPQLNEDGLDLLAKMLLYKPENRLTARMALTHPFFVDVQIVRPQFMTEFNDTNNNNANSNTNNTNKHYATKLVSQQLWKKKRKINLVNSNRQPTTKKWYLYFFPPIYVFFVQITFS